MISKTVQLARDVNAIAIPAGTNEMLLKGSEVHITQELGGSFTVHSRGLLFRIEGKDADALGRETLAPPDEEGDFKLEDEMIWKRLKTCFDPEIPVNIVDLGLVYDLQKRALSKGKYKVFVKMTLTATGCGMGEVIANDARQKILSIPAVDDAVVEIVWDPPWHPSRITKEGRSTLGLD